VIEDMEPDTEEIILFRLTGPHITGPLRSGQEI